VPRGRADIELAHRERVRECDRVTRDGGVDRLGDRLRDNEQLAETALRLRVLADDPRAVGAAV
jgi:hypothetical protein